MNRATPQMRRVAGQLIAYETRQNRSSGGKAPLVFYVCEKLRPPLATLMGIVGFHALLSRALTLAKAEVPSLRAIHVDTDGALQGLATLEAQVDAEDIAEGRVVLLAQLLGLLVAFIGEALTLQLMHDVWPKLVFNDPDFSRS